MIQPPPARYSFPMIDILRGFAAISVIVYHVIEHFGWSNFPISGLLSWFRVGWMGVDMFFVISGFVISLSAFGLIDRYENRGFRRPFAKRRLYRIVPLHFLTCLLFLIAIRPELLYSGSSTGNLIAHVLFYYNLDPDWQGAINGVNWSVAVEMQFYFLILLTAPFLRTCRWWLIPLICLPIAWAWRYGAIQLMPLDDPLGVFNRFWLTTQLPGTLDQFAMGALLARFVRAGGINKLQASVGRLGAGFGGAVAAAILLTAMMMIFWPNASFWDITSMVLFWRTFAAFSFAALVLAACLCELPKPMMQIVAPLRYLGTVSYGLYLWHLLVIESIKRLDWVNGPQALVPVLILTFLLSVGSWHFFEKPFMKRIR